MNLGDKKTVERLIDEAAHKAACAENSTTTKSQR